MRIQSLAPLELPELVLIIAIMSIMVFALITAGTIYLRRTSMTRST